MQRVLVVGGAGVVGSHLVDRLLADGSEVVVVDDLSRGSFANLAHLKRSPRFAFIEHDVAMPYRAVVDRVFHLAVPSTQMACEPDPVKAVMTCVLGTMHALDVAAANGARFLMATAESRWGEGVRCAEGLVSEFGKTRGADVRFVRLPSAYGPRLAPDGEHIVTSLVLQALCVEPLAPSMRPAQRVRLAYVDDVVETLVRSMSGDPWAPLAACPKDDVTVSDLVGLIADAVSSTTAAPATAGHVSLADGLARTVRWFEQRIGRRGDERTSGVYARERRPAAAPESRRAG